MALPGRGLASDFSHGVGRRVRQGARGSRRRLADVNEQDCRITTAIGALPYTAADPALAALSRSANHSKLWFGVAVVLAAGTRHTRRGALRGTLAITGASLLANGVLKPLVPRRRPAAELLPEYRSLDFPPTSSSFPSGHAVGEVRCQSTSRECHRADRSDPVGETRDPAARGASQGPSNA